MVVVIKAKIVIMIKIILVTKITITTVLERTENNVSFQWTW